VGSTKRTKADIRFITARTGTSAPRLKESVFREDLYYRINVISLQIPPLRDRKDDIRALVKHYLENMPRRWGNRSRTLRARPWRC